MEKKERAVKDECFYTVFGWMTNPKKMNLSGLELQLFAIIYGFCQNQPLNGYYASSSYLAEFTGATSRGVRKALDSLIKKGYIIREEQEKYQTYKYIALVPDFEEQSSKTERNNVPSEELSSASEELSSPNNIINNNNNISNKQTKKEGSSFCSFSDCPNVKLTVSELIYLNRYYGQKLVTKYINKLNLHIAKSGRDYRSHLDVIEKWICEDNPSLEDGVT